jgi:hypothetical protein
VRADGSGSGTGILAHFRRYWPTSGRKSNSSRQRCCRSPRSYGSNRREAPVHVIMRISSGERQLKNPQDTIVSRGGR